MNKLLVICGPTATGKTALGIKLAKKYKGKIISADSRQIFKGMDIGTGKDLPGNAKFKAQNAKLQLKTKNYKYNLGYYSINKIPVWLYDIVAPDYKFSVADYVECAKTVIKGIWRRKELPILIGGTGFYLKGLIDGYGTIGIKQDWELREKLKNLRTEELKGILKKIDPKRLTKMNQSDRNNPRRLIRAIEIATAKDTKLNRKGHKIKPLSNKTSLLMIGLRTNYKSLYKRIDERVEKRVKQGIEKEIKRLLKKGYSWENSVLGTTIGYKEWKDYISCYLSRIACRQSEKETLQHWQFAEHAYARRQMTWFKKDPRIHWFDISQKGWQDKVEKLVKKWYPIK